MNCMAIACPIGLWWMFPMINTIYRGIFHLLMQFKPATNLHCIQVVTYTYAYSLLLYISFIKYQLPDILLPK